MGFGGWLESSSCKEAIDAERLEPGDFIEYTGYNDDNEDMGAVLGHVLGTNSNEGQRWVKIHVVATADEYYDWWLNPDTNSGWYHLCAGFNRRTCKAPGSADYIHVDYWRRVGLQDLLDPGLQWARKGPRRARVRGYLAKLSKEVGDGQIPNERKTGSCSSREAGHSVEKGNEPLLMGDDMEGSESDGDAARNQEDKSGRKKNLQESLKKLKSDLKGDHERSNGPPAAGHGPATSDVSRPAAHEGGAHTRRTALTPASGEEAALPFDPRSKIKHVSFSLDHGAEKRGRSPSSGSPGKGLNKKRRKKHGRKKHKKKRRKSSSDSCSSSDGTSSSSLDFRAASSSHSLGSHARLQRYAEKHPGRLASALLVKMEQDVTRDGEAINPPAGSLPTPAVARAFFLRVLLMKYPNMGARYKRELKTLCVLLDMTSLGKGAQVADIIAQRVKAIEKAVSDGGNWARAQYLELVEPENATMLTKDEEIEANRQYKAETALNQSWQTGVERVAVLSPGPNAWPIAQEAPWKIWEASRSEAQKAKDKGDKGKGKAKGSKDKGKNKGKWKDKNGNQAADQW